MNSCRFTLILIIALHAGCSTTGKNRVYYGAAVGAGAGAIGGMAFSPNNESRGLNALVFGLTGALAGGLVALLTDSEPKNSNQTSLKDRELGSSYSTREFTVLPTQELPDFLKGRIQPPVIEEYVERDQVTEEGSLHEPHKAYRIKRPAELLIRPIEPTHQNVKVGGK